MLSPPSLSPDLVTVILERLAVMLPVAEMAFSSLVVELYSPLVMVWSVVISSAAE